MAEKKSTPIMIVNHRAIQQQIYVALLISSICCKNKYYYSLNVYFLFIDKVVSII